jgi:hypothetical protein
LDRNGLSVSTETACRFQPKSHAENSEICSHTRAEQQIPQCVGGRNALRSLRVEYGGRMNFELAEIAGVIYRLMRDKRLPREP